MKKKDNSWLMNLLTTALTVILMLLILVKVTGTHEDKKEKPTEEQEVKEEVKEFRNSELILWDLFLKEAKQQGYIIEDELESIELVSIDDYGRYLKEKPYIRYEQINFKFTCKDKTENCITPKLKQIAENKPIYKKLVIIDLEKRYLQISEGFTFKMSDNLVPIEGPFIFVGEED